MLGNSERQARFQESKGHSDNVGAGAVQAADAIVVMRSSLLSRPAVRHAQPAGVAHRCSGVPGFLLLEACLDHGNVLLSKLIGRCAQPVKGHSLAVSTMLKP